MSDRLIPRGEMQFKDKLNGFARTASASPERFAMSPDEAAALLAAAQAFEQAVLKARGGMRSEVTTQQKKIARAEAERLYTRFVRRARLSEQLDVGARVIVGLREPSEKRRRAQLVPQEPPALRFIRSLHEGSGAAPVHELSFGACDEWRGEKAPGTKPAGAVRIELFVDLIGPEDPVPARPGENDGGRPWYLRSFSRSPIRITPPMCRAPMMVVYWGRWADATGNVGPWSATVESRIEGWSLAMLSTIPARGKTKQIMGERTEAGRGPKYSVVVLEAQQQSLIAPDVSVPEPRQLEGPAASEAA
jgi:hypothetical protein